MAWCGCGKAWHCMAWRGMALSISVWLTGSIGIDRSPFQMILPTPFENLSEKWESKLEQAESKNVSKLRID